MRLIMPFIILILSACGKTGDLYLPDENKTETVPTEESSVKAETSAEK